MIAEKKHGTGTTSIYELRGNDIDFQIYAFPQYSTNNAHMYYLVSKKPEERTHSIQTLKAKNIHPVFHYLSLHKSPYYKDKHDGLELHNSDRYEECLVRKKLQLID